jgi:hypothetical protein
MLYLPDGLASLRWAHLQRLVAGQPRGGLIWEETQN